MGHAWNMRFSQAPSWTEIVCRQRLQWSCSSGYAQCMRPSLLSHYQPWASTAAASGNGARALRLSQESARQQRGRNSLTIVRAAEDDAEYIERPQPVRRSVALPRALNSAGKLFTFAALLKILVIAHGAVPWSTVSGWEAIITMMPFGLALVLLARYLLQINFMQRRGSMFMLFTGAALFIVAQAKLMPAARHRKEVSMQPAEATVATSQPQEAVQGQRPLVTGQDADHVWEAAERSASEAKAKGEASKRK